MADTVFTARETTVKAEWCNEVNNLVYKIFGLPTTADQLFYLTDGQCNIGDYGTEESGININGTIYAPKLRVNDIGGTNPAQFVLHRHSTTLAPLLIGARANNNTSSHTAVTTGQSLFQIYAAGWTASHYDLFASIDFQAGSGTISATSSPGKILFYTTADGSNALTERFEIDSDATAANTSLQIYDVDTAGMERVSVGAADSGGAGYKLLRIAN